MTRLFGGCQFSDERLHLLMEHVCEPVACRFILGLSSVQLGLQSISISSCHV